MAKRKDFKAQALPHLDDLYCTSLYVVGNGTDAQNLVQESFATAYHSWHERQFSTNCRVWLFTIMTNVLVNKYGLSFTRPDTTINADEANAYLAHSWLVNQRPVDASGQVNFSAISEDEVRKTIADLPNDFKLILVLSQLEGFSYQEVANITGIHLETVRSRLHQGHDLIRRGLLNHVACEGMHDLPASIVGNRIIS